MSVTSVGSSFRWIILQSDFLSVVFSERLHSMRIFLGVLLLCRYIEWHLRAVPHVQSADQWSLHFNEAIWTERRVNVLQVAVLKLTMCCSISPEATLSCVLTRFPASADERCCDLVTFEAALTWKCIFILDFIEWLCFPQRCFVNPPFGDWLISPELLRVRNCHNLSSLCLLNETFSR